MKKTLTIGKMRGLQQCASPRGVFAVLALDHRQNLRHALNPTAPHLVTDTDMTAFKLQTVAALAPAATAVLLDPEFGAAQCIAAGALPGGVGLLTALEATGYAGDAAARRSAILPGWSVLKAKQMGASAVKLLVYYHPESPTAGEIECFVQQVAGDCTAHDLALFLEPLAYSLHPARKKLPPGELRRVVIESARRLCQPGVDVLKAEFPYDIAAGNDVDAWAEACAELSSACLVPWVLLSASVDFMTYLRQVAVACQAGASGVAVGRAVWKEAVLLANSVRGPFLQHEARRRMARLTALCEALARPWTDVYAPAEISPAWYQTYA